MWSIKCIIIIIVVTVIIINNNQGAWLLEAGGVRALAMCHLFLYQTPVDMPLPNVLKVESMLAVVVVLGVKYQYSLTLFTQHSYIWCPCYPEETF